MPGMFGGGGGGSLNAWEIGNLNNQQTIANRPNQSNAFGSTNWSGGQPILDSQGRETGRFSPWTSTQTLSPYQQNRFDIGSNLLSQARGELQPLDTKSLTPWGTAPVADEAARQAATNAVYGQATSRLDPQWAQRETAMKGQLAAQGLHPGDAAYEQQMQSMNNARNDAYNQANFSAVGAGQNALQSQFGMGLAGAGFQNQERQQQIAQQLQQSGWTLNQINALMAGIQGAPNAGQPDPNQASAVGPSMQAGMYNQNQQNSQINNLAAGAAGMIGALSDERAKDITGSGGEALEEFLEAATPGEYSYKPEYQSMAGNGTYVSPMAQGLERSRLGRDLVFETPIGKAVDYGKGFGTLTAALSHINRKLNTVMGV